MRETNKAKHAFEDYFNLGPGRSLAELAKRYQRYTKSTPPTKHLRTLKKWSSEHKWQERITQRNAEIAAAILEEIKEKATKSGYAIFQKRIHDLNQVAELLLEELLDEDKRWLPDVKAIGSSIEGTFERVDIVRFNSALIEQFRKTLEDIAAEMGERVKGIEVSGKEGGPIEIKDIEEVRRKRWERVAPAIATALTESEEEETDES